MSEKQSNIKVGDLVSGIEHGSRKDNIGVVIKKKSHAALFDVMWRGGEIIPYFAYELLKIDKKSNEVL